MVVAKIDFFPSEIGFMQHVHHLLGQLDERLRRIDMAGPLIRVRVLDHVAVAIF